MVTRGSCSLSTIILKENRLSQSIDLNKFWSLKCETPSLSTLDVSFNSIPEVICSVNNSVFPLTALFASNNQLSRASDIFPFLAQIAFLQVVDLETTIWKVSCRYLSALLTYNFCRWKIISN